MMCFCKIVNFGPINNILVQWYIEPHRGHTNKLCSDWGHNIDDMAVFWNRLIVPL